MIKKQMYRPKRCLRCPILDARQGHYQIRANGADPIIPAVSMTQQAFKATNSHPLQLNAGGATSCTKGNQAFERTSSHCHCNQLKVQKQEHATRKMPIQVQPKPTGHHLQGNKPHQMYKSQEEQCTTNRTGPPAKTSSHSLIADPVSLQNGGAITNSLATKTAGSHSLRSHTGEENHN